MRTIFALGCALALATGCATSQPTAPIAPTATAPPAPKVAPSRDDCPQGYAYFTDKRGRACWRRDRVMPPPACQPFRCPDTGYLLWDCPEPAAIAPASDVEGNPIPTQSVGTGSLPAPKSTASEPLVGDGPYVPNDPDPSLRSEADVRDFYRKVEGFLRDADPHKRYHAYWVLEDQSHETPSDTLINFKFSNALASLRWVPDTVLNDLRHCDSDLARAAAETVMHFRLKGALEVHRFRGTMFPEGVRLYLLRAWLSTFEWFYDDRAEAAKIYEPVLDELAKSDPSPLIRKAAPLYKQAIVAPGNHGHVHCPGGYGTCQPGSEAHLIYETEYALPLPEPHEGGGRKGTCPSGK